MMNILPQDSSTRPAFWGRKRELDTIYKYLYSTPPQSCALIGEDSFGKTSLLRSLSSAEVAATVGRVNPEKHFTFVYLNCDPYGKLARLGNYASVRFWWDLYSALCAKLGTERNADLPELVRAATEEQQEHMLEKALELKFLLEDLIRQQTRPVIFLFDKFEGVARLSLRDSEWLRSLLQYPCAYIAASRHLFYLRNQYPGENEIVLSPLENLFQNPVYLGLLARDEIKDFTLNAQKFAEQDFSFQAKNAESVWKEDDSIELLKIAGRHPGLIRLACARLFQQRLLSQEPSRMHEKEFMELSFYRDAYPTCKLLWKGLDDPEHWGVPGTTGQREQEASTHSPYKQAVIALAHEQEVKDKTLLFNLEQRGLIEYDGSKWRVFAKVMRHFVLEQDKSEQTDVGATIRRDAGPQKPAPAKRNEAPLFTHLEDKVYAYLQAHLGQVCDRDEIKQAIWGQEKEPPTNSALQKIIERIREKIEPDPANPRYLLAVRGRGYLLRERTSKL